MTIYFYSVNEVYGGFSNFAPYGFTLDGVYWSTSEHFFQAQKFEGTEYAKTIRQAKSPKMAADMGRSREHPLCKDWETVKENVMRRALIQKFTEHQDLRQLLLDTDDQEIVENSPIDYYWGCGQDGTGKNMLGKILMEVRDILRQRSQE